MGSGRAGAGVLYVAGEGHAGIRKRAKAWLISHDMGPDDTQPALYITSQGADLIGNARQVRVTAEHAAEALGVPIELVVFDTLAANFGAGDENKASDMSLAIAGARAAHAEAAVLVVHHTGHGQNDRERGSYALIAAADFRLQATYDEPDRLLTLTWLKCKDDEIPEPMAFERRKVAIEWTDEDGEELTSVVLERLEGAGPRHTMPRGIGKLGKNQEIALKTLTALYARVRRNLELDHRDPDDAFVLTDGWRRSVEKKIERNRWPEVVKGLQERGLIVIEGPHVRLIQEDV